MSCTYIYVQYIHVCPVHTYMYVQHILFIVMVQAYAQDVVQTKLRVENVQLKCNGYGEKHLLDNRICLFCLQHPNTYNNPSSLDSPSVIFEEMKEFGMSVMHLKKCMMELLWSCGVEKRKQEIGCSKKEAKEYFQMKFLSEEGGGLRIYFPEPSGLVFLFKLTFLSFFLEHT